MYLLSAKERNSAGLLIVLMSIMALLDMIGVASILPFMAILANSKIIETNSILNLIFQTSHKIGIQDHQEFLFALGVLVFILLVTSLLFKAVTTYAQLRFIQLREYSISKSLIEAYLNQPYVWFLSRHSADLGKNILSEVQQLVNLGIRPLIELIGKGMIAVALIVLLILAEPKLALVVGLSLSSSYFIIYYFIRNYLTRIGEIKLKNNQFRFTAISEALGAFKEVKVGALEEIYIKNFSNSAKAYAFTQASSQAITQIPRFILEAIAFGGILLIILYTMNKTGNFINSLPIISLYVFAGYRLLPAFQQIYASFTQLAFIGPSLNRIYEDFINLRAPIKYKAKKMMKLNKSINIKEVNYRYPNSSRVALKNINLVIPVKSTVGLVGATGSGKTTIVDIILGLLEPQKGTLEVDKKIITKENMRSWQRSIGYVPQQIYLSDDTVESNIAFGVEVKNINQSLVKKAAKVANIHDFIFNDLPQKYQTIIGERGVKLSGGQRQRIGIARAIYNNPKILILDEATSALDSQTEKKVMDAINSLSKDLTMIIVAHRLKTLSKCDKLFLLEKGEIKDIKNFQELLKSNEEFRKNVKNRQ